MNEKLFLDVEEDLEQVYCKPDTLTDIPFHYCPG